MFVLDQSALIKDQLEQFFASVYAFHLLLPGEILVEGIHIAAIQFNEFYLRKGCYVLVFEQAFNQIDLYHLTYFPNAVMGQLHNKTELVDLIQENYFLW